PRNSHVCLLHTTAHEIPPLSLDTSFSCSCSSGCRSFPTAVSFFSSSSPSSLSLPGRRAPRRRFRGAPFVVESFGSRRRGADGDNAGDCDGDGAGDGKATDGVKRQKSTSMSTERCL